MYFYSILLDMNFYHHLCVFECVGVFFHLWFYVFIFCLLSFSL